MELDSTCNEWRPVAGYEGFYEINRDGQVKSLYKRNYGALMTQRIRRGYYTVQLSNGKKTNTEQVHRLVALTYIPKPPGKDYVNHINFNRLDNRVENLEFVTASENMQHARRTGLLVAVGAKKRVINTCTGDAYDSAKEAAMAIGINYKTLLSTVLNHPGNTNCLKYAS